MLEARKLQLQGLALFEAHRRQDYVAFKCRSPASLSYVAQQCWMAAKTMSRRFSNATGLHAGATGLRMLEACKLDLRGPEM